MANDIKCEVCHFGNRAARMLLCDGCDKGYHIDCLSPPLPAVPTTRYWFCPSCFYNFGPNRYLFIEDDLVAIREDNWVLIRTGGHGSLVLVDAINDLFLNDRIDRLVVKNGGVYICRNYFPGGPLVEVEIPAEEWVEVPL